MKKVFIETFRKRIGSSFWTSTAKGCVRRFWYLAAVLAPRSLRGASTAAKCQKLLAHPSKGEKEDLNAAEKRVLKRLAQDLKKEALRSVSKKTGDESE